MPDASRGASSMTDRDDIFKRIDQSLDNIRKNTSGVKELIVFGAIFVVAACLILLWMIR